METGQLPVEDDGEQPTPARSVSLESSVLGKIEQLPADRQGEAFLRAARKVDPDAVRTTGRRSRTLSSREKAHIKYKETTVAPEVMSDPGVSEDASPMEFAIGRANAGDDEYDDHDDDSDGDAEEDYDDPHEFDTALDLALDADDAGLEEYEALRERRRWPTPEPDPCVCGQRAELRGLGAGCYVQQHLTFASRDETQVSLYLCPSTGRKWHQDWPNAGPSSWGDTRLRQLW